MSTVSLTLDSQAVRLLLRLWWIFWDVASVLLHFTAVVLGFTPFSALQTPSSDFITLPVHSGSKHLIPLKHCEKHSLSPQKPHQLWPIGKNLHPSVWEGFSLLDSTLLVKTMLALFRADEPICCGRLEKLPLTIPAVTRKNLLILCDKICATQVTGFKYLNLEEDPHPPHIWAKRTSRASCVRLQQSVCLLHHRRANSPPIHALGKFNHLAKHPDYDLRQVCTPNYGK